MARHQQHRIAVPGGSVHCEIFGSGAQAIPLIGLHGGPGAGAAYLAPLAELADERPVILYDQLGCGRSDIPDDLSLWTIERFVAEVDSVADALGIERFILFGHSWGGFLAIEYALAHPARVTGLILASTASSVASFMNGTRSLIDGLTPENARAIHELGAQGKYEDPFYLAAVQEFYEKHLCRRQPWPEELLVSVGNLGTTPVYPYMNGPNEFTINGTLLGWDRSADVATITAPTLITCGEFDEIVPACSYELEASIANSKAVVFEGLSHTALNEDPDRVVGLLRSFLAGVRA